MSLTSDHRTTLKRLSRLLSECEDPWWVLGSAAIALVGVDPKGVRDVDFLVSHPDAKRLMKTHGLKNDADGGNALFRSDVLLLPVLGRIPVEVMGNYYIKTAEAWRLLAPQTRARVEVDGATLYVPHISEQIEILMALGRPKDLARIELLRSQA
ncbi:MAG: hypothetical protein AAFY42_04110 [Pseudomonadota bacterium]